MKIIHTSDWHLGQTWDRHPRTDEFKKFLDWMLQIVVDENADCLLVAGDVFDKSNPLAAVQALYYEFLTKIMTTGAGCQTVIVAGNHDSAALLDAPRELLNRLKINVIGKPDVDNELIEVKGKSGNTELLIAAVPFLHDGILRTVDVGDSQETLEQKSIDGMRKHYKDVCDKAEQVRQQTTGGEKIPLVTTGHLFVRGATTTETIKNDFNVGSLGNVGADIFPDNIDYVALGHLHVPQQVAKKETIRYSGSPIPMSFDEAEQEKSVVCIEFNGRTPSIKLIPIPKFSNVIRISGNLDEIKTKFENVKEFDGATYVEVNYTGEEFLPDINELVRDVAPEVVRNNGLMRIRNDNLQTLHRLNAEPEVKLEEMTPVNVFERLMENEKNETLPKKQLMNLYKEVVSSINDN
ncbi:MAG: exonuclease SbcCD subunit D C-terminal domain-containing protein [Planctomycetaceae bacterium]|jgi:exonuclease SbcD|nr:exonuclease SbcCD subunit D C-terminal domain-containing protein [Planctomycetaceae bacterium]